MGARDAGLAIAQPDENGVIFDRADLTVIDTRQMDWQTGPPGSLCKVLERDEFGYASIFLVSIPPGANLERRGEVPFRHIHTAAYEHSFMLAGEFPHAEYETADQQDGSVYVKKPGVFMRRNPGSIHGIENIFSKTGGTLLYWRNPGGGTFVGEDNYHEMSPHVPYDFSKRSERGFEVVPNDLRDDGMIFDRPDFSAIDTRRMDWQRGPGLPGAYSKILERDARDVPVVFIVYLPPGDVPSLRPLEPVPPSRHYHRTATEYSFVLGGELPTWEYESAEQPRGTPAVLKPGAFVRRRPGSIHGIEPELTSRTGAVVLCWRNEGIATFAEEEGYADVTVDVPY